MEAQETILPNEDEEISDFVTKSMKKDGISFITKSFVKEAKILNDKAKVNIANKEYFFDKVLVAIGVTGNIKDIGLENLKIETSSGFIEVNNRLETNCKDVYAIGDVIGHPCLAHKGSHDAVVCSRNISGESASRAKKTNIPSCIYSTPQVASIGLTEKEARKNHNIKIGRSSYAANGKAVAINEDTGFVKIIFNSDNGELLGAHIVGMDATELISGFAIGKTAEIVDIDFQNTIFPHPTISEIIYEASLDADLNM